MADPRPVDLDISALSPAEYAAYAEFVADMDKELAKKGGQMRFAEAAMVIRKWFEFEPEKEDEIRCFFTQKVQLGGMRLGSSLAILRLLAHTRTSPGIELTSDHVFTQTRPLLSSKAGSYAALVSPMSKSNPFREATQTTTIDTTAFTSEQASRTGGSSPMPSLATAASPFVRTSPPVPNRTPPFGDANSSPLLDSNPFRNRTKSVPETVIARLASASLNQTPPMSPPATSASISPPLPPRPVSIQDRWPPQPGSSKDGDAVFKAPPPPPPPKHHSTLDSEASSPVRPGRSKLTRSDSSPPTSRPATSRRSSALVATSPGKPTRPKIQSTTTASSGFGSWIVPDTTGSSSTGAPSLAPKPKLVSSTHLGMDTRLRPTSSVSPQPTGLATAAPSPSLAGTPSGGAGDDDVLLRPKFTKAASDASGGSSSGQRYGGASGLTPGMGLQYETIASSSIGNKLVGAGGIGGPPAPPPRKKKPALDTRSQPDADVFSDPPLDEAAEDAQLGRTGGRIVSGGSLGRSKTVGHSAAYGKGPPPMPPPRRKQHPESMQLHNPNASTLEDVARQPTGDAEAAPFSPSPSAAASTTSAGAKSLLSSSSSHRRASSMGAGALGGGVKNLKALETGLATTAAYLRQDSRNLVKDIQDGWSRRHGKADEKVGLVGGGGRKGVGRRKSGWTAEDAEGDVAGPSDDEGGWARLD